MSTPPPLPAKQKKTDWWSRNWKWFVPILCTAVILLFGVFFNTVLGFLKSSGAYQSAVAQARGSELVQNSIGSPIETSWLVTGKISLSGQSGHASLSIPIQGPTGKAKIHAIAHKSAGEWKFEHLVVLVADEGPRIDLLRVQEQD